MAGDWTESEWRAVKLKQRFSDGTHAWRVEFARNAPHGAGEVTVILADWLTEDVARKIAASLAAAKGHQP